MSWLQWSSRRPDLSWSLQFFRQQVAEVHNPCGWWSENVASCKEICYLHSASRKVARVWHCDIWCCVKYALKVFRIIVKFALMKLFIWTAFSLFYSVWNLSAALDNRCQWFLNKITVYWVWCTVWMFILVFFACFYWLKCY